MKHYLVCLFLVALLAMTTIEGASWTMKACTGNNFGGKCDTETNSGSGCYPVPVSPLRSFKITIPKNCEFNLWRDVSCYGSRLGHATKTWQVNTVSAAASKSISYSMEGQDC